MITIRVLQPYRDNQLNKDVIKGECYEVTYERYKQMKTGIPNYIEVIGVRNENNNK